MFYSFTENRFCTEVIDLVLHGIYPQQLTTITFAWSSSLQ